MKFVSYIVLKFVSVWLKHLRVFLENLRKILKMCGNVCVTFRQVLENFRTSSESSQKSSENRQKRRHQHVYIIKRTLHVSSKIWILCSHGKYNISLTLFSPLEHKIDIFSPPCNILCILGHPWCHEAIVLEGKGGHISTTQCKVELCFVWAPIWDF